MAVHDLRRRAARLLPLGALLWSLSSAGCVVAAGPTTQTVTMEGLRFEPATLRLHPGDTVVWVNKDLFPHTATAESRAFDSGEIGLEGSWRWTAREAGKFAYVCTYHPTMKGTLIVE